MGVLKSTIKLVNKYSAEADKIAKSAREMGNAMQKAVSPVEKLNNSLKKATNRTHQIKIKDLGSKEARNNIRKLNEDVNKLSKGKYKVNLEYKQSRIGKAKEVFAGIKDKTLEFKTRITGLAKATLEAKKMQKELKKATGKSWKISLKDVNGKGILSRLKDINKELGKAAKASLGKIGKGLMIGGGVLASAGAVVGKKALDKGMTLETQQLSMSHFMKGDEVKSAQYLKGLRKNAALTPFNDDEVIAAGTQAIQVTLGDTKRAMDLIKTAEDMAAMTPGATLEEAMNALRSADVGNMESLKRFGFQGTKEDLDAAGGDVLKMKSSKGLTLNDMYGGGAEKLSKSGAGKLSTIKGQLATGFTDTGKVLLDKISPVFDKLLPMSDRIAEEMPKKFGEILEKLEVFIEPVKNIFSSAFDAVQPLMEPLKSLGSAILPIVGSAFQIIGSFINSFVAPAFQILGQFIQGVVVPALQGLQSIIQVVVIPAFNVIAKVISATVVPVFKGIVSVVSKVTNAFKSVAGCVESFKNKISRFNPFKKNKGEENAQGTSYFSGGITKINERGEEFMKLPEGTKIYPHGETKRALAKESRKLFSRSKQSTESVNNNQTNVNNDRTVILKPTFNIYGNDSNENAREIEKRLRRAMVNI